MRRIVFFLFSIFLLSTYCSAAKGEDAREILKRTYQVMNKHKQISYAYDLEINYVSENYKTSVNGHTLLDYTEGENTLGFTFQFTNKEVKIVYNGAESFELNHQDSTIGLSYHPKLNQLSRYSFLNNSFVTLRNSIPEILSSDNMRISMAPMESNSEVYTVIINMGQQVLDKLGNISPITANREIIYTILIDKKNYLPIEVVQRNSVDVEDYVKTKFLYQMDNLIYPQENTWYYSNYPQYRPKVKEEVKTIAINEIIPDWELPSVDDGELTKLSSFGSEYILLEFWIKNCGYCISAVSELNKLQDNYGPKGVKIVGINVGDSQSDIDSFIKRNSPNYPSYWDNNKKLSKSLGVIKYPYVMLLNKERKLLYQGALNSKDLTDLLLKID